ncbi:MAG: DHA2 family efflux MFS transporter permease subunit [Acidobacteriaceae bacterium]|nr:DHA2 family efflux MFS transporter permease subunit [Acidobacteriaceae bacterium]
MRLLAKAGSSLEKLPPGIWKVALVAVLGSFMAQLDATVVNVSLSSLAVELHSALEHIQWVTSGYLLALALLLPLSGWLVDRFGARVVYLGCFVSFTLTSAMCGLAWSANSLIAFRVLQGMSGGLLAPMAQLTMARVAGKHMARVFGYAALPVLLGPVVGPVLAGAILAHASWRWLFLVNVPFSLFALVWSWFVLPKDGPAEHRREFDLVGFALLAPALVTFLYGADHLRGGYGGLVLLGSFVLLAIFVRHALKLGDHAIVDLQVFRGSFRVSALTQFLSNGIAFAGQLLVPYYLVRACGESVVTTGWLMAPLGLGMMLVYPQVGGFTERFGVRRTAVTGSLLALFGSMVLVGTVAHGLSLPVLEVALFVRGMGMSCVSIPSLSSAYISVDRRTLPMATTAMNIVQRLGGPAWTTVVATFLAWRLDVSAGSHAPATRGFLEAFAFLAVIHLAQLLTAMRLPILLHSATEVEAVAS